MALFTGKGDDGTTKKFDTPSGQRFSKASSVVEALGSLDEVNSYLGLCKVLSRELKMTVKPDAMPFEDLVHELQEGLFIVQAEFAGAPKSIEEARVLWVENIIGEIEKEMPEIKTFFVSGGSELAARFDYARTLARRAERKAVLAKEKENIKVDKNTLAFLNRLSSILYALARLSNHKSGITEQAPGYKKVKDTGK
jgi:cob(I)alamin adenosyltransferase